MRVKHEGKKSYLFMLMLDVQITTNTTFTTTTTITKQYNAAAIFE